MQPARVFITGASGFVGAAVARRLCALNCDVGVLMRPDSRTARIADLTDQLTITCGDLRDAASVREALDLFEPQVVIHAAWDGVASRDRNDPRQAENVVAALHLLEAATDAGCRAFLGIGSQAEYGAHDAPVNEEAPTSPLTAYGAAKLSAGTLLLKHCEIHNIRGVWMRLFAAYGPNDNTAWMIPSLIDALLRGQQPPMTAGEQRVDYLYIDDVAEYLARAALRDTARGIINLGSGIPRRVRDVAQTVRDLVDPRGAIRFGEQPYRSDQIMHVVADVTRLRAATGFLPRVSLEQGLTETVAWRRESLARDRTAQPVGADS